MQFNSILTNGIIVFISKYLQGLLTLIFGIILARNLSPNEFAVIALIYATINLFLIFSNFGFSFRIISGKHITHNERSKIRYFHLVISIIALIVFFLIVIIQGRLYKFDAFNSVAFLLAPTIVLGALNFVPKGYFSRNKKFLLVNNIESISILLAGVVAIVMVFNKYGVYSLVALHLVRELIQFLFLQFFYQKETKSRQIIFSMPNSLSWENLSLVSTGFINQISDILKVNSFALWISPGFLGFYNRSKSFENILSNNFSIALGSLVLPYFSDSYRQNHGNNDLFFTFSRVVFFVWTPFILLIGTYGKEIIVYVLGDQWKMSGVIFQILIVVTIFSPLNHINSNAIISTDKTKGLLKWNFIGKLLIVVTALFAYFLSAFTVLWLVILAEIISFVLVLFHTAKLRRFKVINYLKNLSRPILTSLILALVIFCIRFFSSTSFEIELLIQLFILPPVFFFISYLVNFKDLSLVLKLLRIK